MEKKWAIFSIFLVIIIFASLYVSFIPVKCNTYECFRGNMAECNPAIYVNEEVEASWGYEIAGPTQESCLIEVTLLQAKEGDLELLNFEGNSMECYYERGVVAYPEEDLAKCTGPLKENLQERIIQKLHEYIVDNLADIENELEGLQ